MKILWYVNIIFPQVAQHFGIKGSFGGGWIIGQAQELSKNDIALSIVTITGLVKEVKSVTIDNINYILIPDNSYETEFERICNTLHPNLVHIYGTEYKFNTDIINICVINNIKHVVSLQGVMKECASHYFDGLPEKFNRVNPLLKFMKKLFYADSIALEQKEFEKQSILECEAIKKATNVMGRTEFDKEFALSCNPKINYFKVCETLRDSFYSAEKWQYASCEKNTIFISQGFYPIKGLHSFLEAVPKLIKKYPDIKIYIGGHKPYTLKNKYLDIIVDYFFEYQKYIKNLIKKNSLQNYIEYTGPLNANQMIERYLKSNLFLSCATIENSPNSVGEAMLLGVPIVASDVGGTNSMFSDKKEGLLYNFFDSEEMLNCISFILDNPKETEKFSKSSILKASITHDKNKNTQDLLKCYEEVIC